MDIGMALFGTALIVFIVLYPFYIKKYHKHRYKGIVKRMAEMHGTPARALRYPIGYFIGCLIYIMLSS